MPIAIGIMLIGAARMRAGRRPLQAVNAYILAGLLAGGLITASVFLLLPHLEVRLVPRAGMHAKSALRTLALEADEKLGTNQPTIVAVRAAISSLQRVPPTDEYLNPILGGAIREEDSPGNYTVREADDGIELHGYDLQGKDQILWMFSTNETSTGPRN
jgi:hypothetical protein